jgi:hypothetical protein
MFERLKFILFEMKGTGWRTSYTVRTTMGNFTINDAAGSWPHGVATTQAFYRFHVPDGWQPGTSIFLQFYRRNASASGTARMTVQIVRIRDGAAASTLASTDINFLPGDTNTHLVALEANGGSLAVGDVVVFTVNRLGTDGADTNLGIVAPDGHYFQYTGIASR